MQPREGGFFNLMGVFTITPGSTGSERAAHVLMGLRLLGRAFLFMGRTI